MSADVGPRGTGVEGFAPAHPPETWGLRPPDPLGGWTEWGDLFGNTGETCLATQ